jgi:cytidine deaminase
VTSHQLDPEDAKIVTLARATRARSDSAEGAAVRDTTGRTYTAATVALASLRLSALQLAVAMACSSGADGLEAAAVVTERPDVDGADLGVVREVAGADVPVFVADPAGVVRTVVSS